MKIPVRQIQTMCHAIVLMTVLVIVTMVTGLVKWHCSLGIEMCKHLCQRTIGCDSVTYSPDHMTCHWSNTVDVGMTFDIQKTGFYYQMQKSGHCQLQSVVLETHRQRVICLTPIHVERKAITSESKLGRKAEKTVHTVHTGHTVDLVVRQKISVRFTNDKPIGRLIQINSSATKAAHGATITRPRNLASSIGSTDAESKTIRKEPTTIIERSARTGAESTSSGAESTSTDAFSTKTDVGPTSMDVGSTITDAGSTATDVGSTRTDSGSTRTDAGLKTTDVGPSAGAGSTLIVHDLATPQPATRHTDVHVNKTESCKRLVQGAAFNVTSAFIKACGDGDVDLVTCMLRESHMDLEVKAKRGRTPVMVAAIGGHSQVFHVLLRHGCDLVVREEMNRSLLHVACAGGNLDIVKTLVDKLKERKTFESEMKMRDEVGITPVLAACQCGNVTMIKYLESINCNMKVTDNSGRNCLHHACISGKVNLVKMLVPRFGIESKTTWKRTPVVFAVLWGRDEVFDYLLSKGCNLNVRDSYNASIIQPVRKQGSLRITKRLVEQYNLSLESRTSAERTPLLTAMIVGNAKAASYFISQGCDMFAVDNKGRNALELAFKYRQSIMIKLLVDKHSFPVDRVGRKGRTPIASAAGYGNLEMFNFFLKRGADPMVTDISGNTLLHQICYLGNANLVNRILEATRIDVNAREKTGRTALMLAARVGKLEVFKAILEKKADVFIIDNGKNTLFHLTCKGGNVGIVKLLIENRLTNRKRNKFNETPCSIATAQIKHLIYRRQMSYLCA